ncbi:MAG: hypothetical protein RR365_10440 [Bacteroides sp.]
MDTTIGSLQVEVQSNATSAANGLDSLASTLGKLKSATKGGLGLNAVSKQLTAMNIALDGVGGANADNLNKLAQGLQTLSACGNLKLSSSVSAQITDIGTAVKSLSGTDFSVLSRLATDLPPLANMGKANMNSFISQLQRLPQAVQALNSVDMGSLGGKVSELVSALSQLSQMGKNNLTSFITQLSKIPKLMENLKSVDMRTLYNQIQSLVRVFTPLATQMEKVSAGFAAFPSRIQKLIQTTDNLSASNNRTSNSYVNLAAKISIAYVAVTRIARVMANMMNQAVQWDGIAQRFSRSFGEYAQDAYSWVKRLNEEMYINTQQFMQYSSIFASMLKGYGVSQKDAATMAIGYMELAYDVWAGFEDLYPTLDDAATAIRATIAGEVEQIRRAGFTIVDSQLAVTAANHGVAYSTKSATEELKSYLRYITMVDQANAQGLIGTFAREMNTAEGLMRTLKQQLISLAQAFGSVFLPILAKVLPYVQAFVQLITEAIVAIASLFGIEIQPVDFGKNLGEAAVGAGDLEDSLGGAGKKAEKLKHILAGFDELNILSRADDSNSGGSTGIGGGGGALDIEKLWDESIFADVNRQVDEIMKKLEPMITWLKENINEVLAGVMAIGAAFLAWTIAKGVIKALAWLSTMKGFNVLGSVAFKVVGLGLFLDAWNTMKEAIQDIMGNGANFTNITKLISGFAEGLGAAFLLFGKLDLAAPLLIISGLVGIVSEISDMVKNGVNWDNAMALTKNLGFFIAGLGLLSEKYRAVGGIGLVISGVSLILENLKALINGFTTGDFSNVEWIEVASGALMLVGGLIIALKKISETKDKVDLGGAKTAMDTVKTTTEGVSGSVGQLSTKLTTLAKNLGMGLVIVAEVAAAALLITGAIILLGMELEQVGIAWQPVIDNGGTIAAAMGIGVGILAAIGVVTALLGSVGTPLIVNIALGVAILAELGIAAGLFLAEIWAIGKGLDEIGKAWQPVLDNGETIAKGIGLGTALLVGIGVVTAALGVATVASVGLLPLAIGLGTALLVELAVATVLFIESLVVVANALGNDLAPALDDLNGKLPGLTTNMSDFVGFMCGFAGEVARYAGASTVAGIAGTIDTIIGWFTQDPIEKMSNDIAKIAGQTKDLNDKLNVAIPELKAAVNLLVEYVNFVDKLGTVAGSGGTVNLSKGLKVNLMAVGENIVTGFNDGIKNKYPTIQTTITNWGRDVQKWFNNSSFGGVNKEKFVTYANDIANGFKNGIVSQAESAKISMTTWANNIRKYFADIISFSTFYDIAKDVIKGFNNGINNFYDLTRPYMRMWANAAKETFKVALDSNSPSRVFKRIGKDTVLGYNLGVATIGKTTKGVINAWADSFVSASPIMSLAVDTSALRYYDGQGDFSENGGGFIARESGARIASSIGNRTVGFDDAQIIEGIASSNEEQNELLRQQNAILIELLGKESTVSFSPSADGGRWAQRSINMYAAVKG